MVKLIASDIDGTLLQGTHELSQVLFSEIRRLKRNGIVFCAASGRRYADLRRLFRPVADDIAYVCENGAIVYYQDQAIFRKGLPRETAEQIAAEIMSTPSCEVLISGESAAYILPKEKNFLSEIQPFISGTVLQTASLADIHEDMLKVSAYCREGSKTCAREFEQRWGQKVNVAISGECWLDFNTSDKGQGLSALCRVLEIPARDVMAFGDNYNDIPMMRWAGMPYLMKKGITPEQAGVKASVTERVEPVLQQL